MSVAIGRSQPADDLAVLHDEAHPLELVDVVEGIAGHGDEVAGLADGDGAALLAEAQELEAVHRPGAFLPGSSATTSDPKAILTPIL